jgi:DNA-directed RNA polymerase specialized sigma24 family protein
MEYRSAVAQGTSFERFGFGLPQGVPDYSGLLLAAQQGDVAAFQELVHSYDAMVMRVALALTGSKDAAQDLYCRVFQNAFASLDELDSSSSVFVWLYRILCKHCIQYCRQIQRTVPKCRERGGARTLTGSLLCLPPTERVVLLLKHSQGLKVRTLAEIFACSEEHIAEVLRKATNRVRTQVALGARRIA